MILMVLGNHTTSITSRIDNVGGDSSSGNCYGVCSGGGGGDRGGDGASGGGRGSGGGAGGEGGGGGGDCIGCLSIVSWTALWLCAIIYPPPSNIS